ncbi:hypothetical protein BGZ80_003226 [Entomortierella chlamydospora]|uniref:BZIP domain-containing protein n=1 Tax=Entomortierella chlamydospora TaxID=101097 RepID=A0A9P6MP90_9FUNG|nr:hypothetical protein BGZ80_003226 [Entomortierella chlamydospora]
MDFSDRIPIPNEDSDLYQYFFKQNGDSQDLTPFLQNSAQPPTSTSGSSSFAPLAESSPASSTLGLQDQQQQTTSLNPFSLAQPTLLPTTSFSYRQLTPNIPPPMPGQQSSILHAPTSTPVPTATSTTGPQPMDVWMERFQQLQQLQQKHHYQQHQLLSSTLLPQSQESNGRTSRSPSSTHRGSSSERSISPSSPPSSSDNGEKDTIYPSPPMRDDASVDSDDEEHGSDSHKPSASELKKMTSKERRQLRNKLSARNFRVRRKEYISTLENQVKEARREAADLQRRLIQSELNCQFLRQELETTRLSQSLFADGRMSREHANLLASLLSPCSESFPSSSTIASSSSSNMASSSSSSNANNIGSSSNMQHASFMPSVSLNNFAMDSTMSTSAMPQPLDMTQATLQPFVPFDGDWGLLINRAEVPETTIDPKDESSAQEAYEDLLARYEAAKQEAEVDEQMRNEIKAYTEKRLAQAYMTTPKDELAVTGKNSAQETLVIQTLIYMMMTHLTQSLFEAATMSKSELVNVYQTMDEPLRAKIKGQGQNGICGSCKFTDWREAWIRKCWPSFYNNRRRLAELSKDEPPQKNADVVETARKNEEKLKGKTVDVPKVNYFVRHYVPTWLKCPELLERERLEDETNPQPTRKPLFSCSPSKCAKLIPKLSSSSSSSSGCSNSSSSSSSGSSTST